MDYIDGLARQKEPEEEVIKSTNVSVSSRKLNKSIDNTLDESGEDIDDVKEMAEGFINDEAEEAEDDDEDSMDEEQKQYIRDMQIPERDISLGSDHSSAVDIHVGSSSSMDSFIVSDSEDDGLLDGTGDDLSLEPRVVKDKPLRRSRRIMDTSDEDDAKTQEISRTATDNRITTNIIDEGAANEADKLDIDERPPRAGLSKSFANSKTPKKITKLNKSVGQESIGNFNVSDVESDSYWSNQLNASFVSSAGSVDKSKTASPSKDKTKAGLSKSLVEPTFTKKHLKLNKSVEVSLNKLNESVGKRQLSIKEVTDDMQDLQQPETLADATNESSEDAQIQHAASPVPVKRKRSIKAIDCEVESTPPFAKSPINSGK